MTNDGNQDGERSADEVVNAGGDDAASPMAATCVRALLERHGLPKYRHSAWLAEALGLSYSQAHRRLNGTATWTLEDLSRTAALFGETLSRLVSPSPDALIGIRAMLKIGATTLPCEMWKGERIEQPGPDQIVAVHTGSGWSALLAGEAGDSTCYAVERLDVRPGEVRRAAIAVLDDDHDLTNSICNHLNESGYEAHPFYRSADVLAGAAAQRYDAFVVDWLIGETSSLKLIDTIRQQDSAVPIVVLTAQVLTGVVDEAEIAEAVRRYDLVFSEKPVRMSILTATLTRVLAREST